MGRLREGGHVRLGNENLPGLYQERFTDLICQITAERSFQDKELDVELGMTVDYPSRAWSNPGELESGGLFAPE